MEDCLNYGNQKIGALIMNEIDDKYFIDKDKKILKIRKDGDMTNMFKKDMLKVFENVKSVKMDLYFMYFDHWTSK